MKRRACVGLGIVSAVIACSSNSDPYACECDSGNYSCAPGPLVSILTSANEHFYGAGHISANLDSAGHESLVIVVCGKSGASDGWHFEIKATSSPLPLTQSDAMDAPFPGGSINAMIDGHNHLDRAPTSGHLTASAGKIDGSVVVGDPAIDATFTGGFDFTCTTADQDASVQAAFCQQFAALMP